MITLHTILASFALLLGPVVLQGAKGDRRHRRLGYAYVLALSGTDLTALTIYQVGGGPNAIHALALINLATVGFALHAARRRRIDRHLDLMAYSYAGLIAALTARLQPLVPLQPWLAWALLGTGGLLGSRWLIGHLLAKQDNGDRLVRPL